MAPLQLVPYSIVSLAALTHALDCLRENLSFDGPSFIITRQTLCEHYFGVSCAWCLLSHLPGQQWRFTVLILVEKWCHAGSLLRKTCLAKSSLPICFFFYSSKKLH
eukprot:TRINITY_DN36874_c1_g1_i7.p1 TRINITY_DN36874_c1_g1~~TRINITY_DN36874_c1_g1_i7.p1  ORF type:complete len:106 (-),score=5.01 TRINITY_DN36874_c1_g1_i7:558-875(-)